MDSAARVADTASVAIDHSPAAETPAGQVASAALGAASQVLEDKSVQDSVAGGIINNLQRQINGMDDEYGEQQLDKGGLNGLGFPK